MCGIFAAFCDNWSGVELGTSSEGKYRGPDNSTMKSGEGSIFGNGKETGGWVFGFHRLSINGLDTKNIDRAVNLATSVENLYKTIFSYRRK